MNKDHIGKVDKTKTHRLAKGRELALDNHLEGKYVYCIIGCDERRSFGGMGMGGRGDEVYTIAYKDISAVVSDTPLIQYEPSEDNALAHMSVIQRIMEEYTVLPIRFCTIFKGEEGLKKALDRLYDESKEELRKLRGKVEVGVKVLWDPKVATERAREASKRIRDLEDQIRGKTRGIAYLLKVKLSEALKEELNKMADHYAMKILEELKSRAVDSRQSTLIGHMILNGAFLINKEDLESLREFVGDVRVRYQPQGLELIFSGPWPPYNFVKINYV